MVPWEQASNDDKTENIYKFEFFDENIRSIFFPRFTFQNLLGETTLQSLSTQAWMLAVTDIMMQIHVDLTLTEHVKILK